VGALGARVNGGPALRALLERRRRDEARNLARLQQFLDLRGGVRLTRGQGGLTADSAKIDIATAKVVLFNPLTNLLVMAGMFTLFLVFGTALFVRQETNR